MTPAFKPRTVQELADYVAIGAKPLTEGNPLAVRRPTGQRGVTIEDLAGASAAVHANGPQFTAAFGILRPQFHPQRRVGDLGAIG